MNILKYTIFLFLLLTNFKFFSQSNLDSIISNFSYENREEMKISSEQIVQLLQDKQAVLLDIRFEEEQAAWQMDYALKIPLPSLPFNYKELPKDKLIVTACPHKDRAIIAMIYLQTKGYKVAYLSEGLIGLADYLRGDKAKDFINKLKN